MFDLSLPEIIAALLGLIALAKFIFGTNIKQDAAIADIVKDVSFLAKEMKSVKDNHLPHIEDELRGLSKKVNTLAIIIDERIPKK